jgi:hypothetical protein
MRRFAMMVAVFATVLLALLLSRTFGYKLL